MKKAGHNFLFFIFRNLKNIKIFAVCWLFMIIVFLIMDRNNKKITYYISTEYMSGQKIDLILKDLKSMINQSKYKSLSDALQIPLADAKKIKSINVTVEDPEYLLSAGGELGPNYYYNETNTQVKIGLKDSLNVKDLVDHINAFIVHSNFFNKVKYNETAMVSLINKNLELQKTDLDSMNKLNLNKFTSPGSNIIYANDISEIKRNIYSIDEKLIRNQRGIIRLDDPINLINYPILVQPSLIEAILMAAIKSLLLLIPLSIVLFVSRFWKKARAAFKQNPMA